MKYPVSKQRRRWARAAILAAYCWVFAFLSIASLLIIPIVLIGALVFAVRRNWLALGLLLTLNPLGAFFIGGMVSYARGAPALRFVGHPGLESFNLDPSSRCFQHGGGCLVSGNEWVAIGPHNAALRLLSFVLGAPHKSYDGPYPSKDEALALLTGAPVVPLSDLLADRIRSGNGIWALEDGVGEALVRGLCYLVDDEPDPLEEYRIEVHAAFHQERCLILHIRQKGTRLDCLVLLDRAKGKPFAYFSLLGHGPTAFPPVEYDDPPYLAALQLAAAKGDTETLRRLVKRGVNIDLQSDTGRTALMTAVARDHQDTAAFLLSQGASVRLKDNNGKTALQLGTNASMDRFLEREMRGRK